MFLRSNSSHKLLGGMIALGIGIHGWNAATCITKFREICKNGLSAKWLTKSWAFGFLARWVRGSIYSTDELETALKNAYPDECFFGLHAGSYHDKTGGFLGPGEVIQRNRMQ